MACDHGADECRRPQPPGRRARPRRFANHMMIVADLENGNADAIEDAVIGAWELQCGK
jgi:hypothetical protein